MTVINGRIVYIIFKIFRTLFKIAIDGLIARPMSMKDFQRQIQRFLNIVLQFIISYLALIRS